MKRHPGRSILIALSLCCPVFYATAQCPDTAKLNITATLYTQENGLTSNVTVRIAKDTTGYLYFLGVDEKWNRYDGIGFSVSGGYVPSDSEQRVFYTLPESPYGKDTLLQYILRYGEEKATPLVTIINQYLFITGAGTSIYEVNLDNHEVYKIDLAKYISIDNPSRMNIIMLDHYHDRLLIATSDRGLLIFDRCMHTLQQFEYKNQNSSNDLTNSVTWIAVESDNMIWMQTDGGLIKLEVNHQLFKTYLPSDAEHGSACSNCNNIRAIYNQDDDHLLIASLEGLQTFNLGTQKFNYLLSPVDQKPVWNDLAISAITDNRRGTIFISSWANQGILLYNPADKKLLNIFSASDFNFSSLKVLRCLYYDSHHVLWVGTSNGFIRIQNLDEFIDHHYTGRIDISDQFPGTPSNQMIRTGSCFAITEDTKGNVWLGTNEGVFVYQYATGAVVKFVHQADDPFSLNDNDVRSVYISKNDDVWIGTNHSGLNHFDASTSTFSTFTTENGLRNNSIYSIMEDRDGFLWLGTNGGLCRFNKTDHSIRNYTTRDGTQNDEFNTNAVAMTHDGKFCFGGRTGFNIFHPDSMNVQMDPPHVVITEFKIFDEQFPVTHDVMRLTHDQNSFTFDFAALGYYRSSDNQYAYTMVGAEKDWIKSGNRRYTSYHNLSPGTYQFKVRAANYTGVWNEKMASMSFVISPAWYNTWWFRMAIVLIIASGIYAFYRFRLRQLLNLQDVRNRIARDLHDEIGSTLSSISLSSTIIQGKLNGSHPEVDKMLHKVSNNTDKMMDALSDIVWTINTHHDRFDNVVNRMRALAFEILEPSNIVVQFNVSEDIGDIQLDMQQRKNIYLIFKEAINNIAKYSGCNLVQIDIIREVNKTLVMHIKDNGKGFDVPVLSGNEKSLSGNGIRNMRKRANELGGQLMIESAIGGGSIVQLSFEIGK